MRDMRWETLDKEYLVKRPWLTARRDTVKLPSGVVMDEYYVLEYPDWINVIARTKDGNFVFIRQYRYALGQACFELVAGVVEQGEAPVDAAKRELLEETGYAGGEWQEIMTISANASTMNNLTHCFLAEGVEKVAEQNLEATEDIEVHIMTTEEVRSLMEKGEMKQALMAAPLWKYFCCKEG